MVWGGNLFTIYGAAAQFHWQPLEVAHKKSACNSIIDDDLKNENEHIQTFHKERMNSQYQQSPFLLCQDFDGGFSG